MKFNFKLESDQVKAREYLDKLIAGEKPCELKEMRKKRTNLQNAYLHAILNEMAVECGYTALEMKCEAKTKLGYTYVKNGTPMYTETSKMNTKELSEFTEKFLKLAQDHGYDLMSPEEFNQGGWVEAQKKKEQFSKYL